jgi:MerR family transcriptional regulator, light-induced transcriptional regulator
MELAMQLRDAAEVLGVHYQTAYAWVRQGVLPARKTGHGYDVSESDVTALAARRALGTAPQPHIRVRDWAAQADRLYAAIMAGDETVARHVVARLARGVPLTDLCQRIIAPALYRIGEDWAAGRVTIAAEHRASAICERLIAARARQPQGRPRGIAVVTTPPGERHGLPALMATACLREDRWLVHHLAADLPVAEVTGLARQAGASLVVLSSATTESARLAVQAADEITRSAAGLRVLAGHPGGTLSELLELARVSEDLASPRTPRSDRAARKCPLRWAPRPAASCPARRSRPRRNRSCRSIPTGCTPARRGLARRRERSPASGRAG